MKRLTTLAAFALFAATAAHADPVHGVWQTQPGDDGSVGHVQLSACGAKTCGVIVRTFDGAGKAVESDNIGKRMVWDMEPKGSGKYGGGKIWAPDRDKTYNSKMTLSGNSLKVEGCVAIICRGQTWSRVQ